MRKPVAMRMIASATGVKRTSRLAIKARTRRPPRSAKKRVKSMRFRGCDPRAQFAARSYSFAGVPWRRHGKDAFIPAHGQHPVEKASNLIVEEKFIPLVFHE